MEAVDEGTKLKTAMYVLKISGLQGYAKPPKQLTKEERDKQTFLDALEEVLTEMGHTEEEWKKREQLKSG